MPCLASWHNILKWLDTELLEQLLADWAAVHVQLAEPGEAVALDGKGCGAPMTAT